MTNYKYLFSLVALFLYHTSLSQITEAIIYESFSNEEIPTSIEIINDQGFLIAANENNKGSLLRIDTNYNVQWYRTDQLNSKRFETQIKSLVKYTDSTYINIFYHKIHQDSLLGIAITEIGTDGNYLKQKLLYPCNFGDVTDLKIDNDGNILLTSSNGKILCLDSSFKQKWATTYLLNELPINIKRIKNLLDSTKVAIGFIQNNYAILKIDSQGNILWAKTINQDNYYNSNMNLTIKDSTIYTIHRSGYQKCNLISFDLDGNIKNEFIYQFNPVQFTYESKFDFIRVENGTILFYAGNNLFEVSSEGEIINQLGNHVGFHDYYINDTLSVLLVKNGDIPAIQPNQEDGAEFGILVGNNIDSIINSDLEQPCIYEPYSYYDVTINTPTVENIDVTTSSTEIMTSDSLNVFIDRTITKKYSCPEAPNSISNDELPTIELYPLPASNKLTIKSSEQISEIYLYSINGNLVNNISNLNVQEYNLDVSDYQNGFYIIDIRSDKNRIVKKVVITQ